ncbi:gem-associated protein 7 [Corythoichthys intestinalis]|uniref:gem-associated protein 7 n=1 Tax=Corythoichthys intestinalis TaxID=161448 RepID=UPI0025A6631B|nr:gem-associated protein 7 [Corythoichthys intestinalis]XP_057695752.1 gem-associated protein 7 [Corythoichthys intestinalis]XP_061796969.1 gem-associated protein 7-like [Nerophis lumbriciformis]
MDKPVPVLRLPRGPDPHSRGFDPNSPRYIDLCSTSITSSSASSGACANPEELKREQQVRAELRERFLRCVLATRDKKVSICMHGDVTVDATFGGCDIDVLNLQVSDLHTPIGVQKEALIRCQDIISYSFDL